MPIAHACASCGHDLTRIPAPLDAHYALPIVVCPLCSAAVVRRADGARAVRRGVRRRLHATRRFAESVILLLIFSAGFMGLCWGLQSGLESHRLPFFEAMQGLFTAGPESRAWQWRNDVGIVVFVIWAIMGLASGAYLGSAARHSSRLRVLALWCVPAAIALAMPVVIMVWFEVVASTRTGGPGPPRFIPRRERWFILHVWQVLTGAAILLGAGAPLGLLLRGVLDGLANRRFRRVRKRHIARRRRA
ncbi:MAG: hypothetical protein IT438_04750 [Phycisphaerales bacterium]|nr:hypothetical protein [Phycisphaerales bacterium]